MNFFEHQDRARRNTRYLILLLIAAVVSLIVITVSLFAVATYVTGSSPADTSQPVLEGIIHSLSPGAFFIIASTVSAVVGLGSFFRLFQLRSGGRSVAEALNARLLSGNTTDIHERKILNVVEEMAIASGTAVPPVYVLEEQSINAFAAGYHPQDAIIGITRGCIENLSRDELQGVIAHEFSHIFHGDMRINMRLVSLLYGILLIGLIGEFVMRVAGSRGANRSSKDQSPFFLLILGLGLSIIGYTGIFFGNLIKAAVSRQREFLADASAVQFTRNPDGIVGALKKIGGSTYGSELQNKHAAEFSHMYFGQGVNPFLTLMATHPPLEARIKRLQPNWNGEFSTSIRKETEAAGSDNASAAANQMVNSSSLAAAQIVSALGSQLPDARTSAAARQVDIEVALRQLAQPTIEQVKYARERLIEIPESLKIAAHESFGARAIVFGLLLDEEQNIAQRQVALLREKVSESEFRELLDVIRASSMLIPRLRLPILELCFPALKQLSKDQHAQFLGCINILINADKKVSLMEWALYRIVLHNTVRLPLIERVNDLRHLQKPCETLLSVLAHAGAKTNNDACEAFRRAQSELPFQQMNLLPKGEVHLAHLDPALDQLSRLKPLQKPQLLKAMSLCVLHDAQVTIVEAELFRAIADSLDCPMPPLILENVR